MTKRDAGLDVAKTLAMFAIVLLHVRTNTPQTDYGLVTWLDNFMSTSVLSLFVLVSGYLARGLILSGDVFRLVRRLVACVWPILPMMALLGPAIAYCALGRYQPPAAGWVRHLLTAGWFFLCLATCLALTFAVQVVSRGRGRVTALVLLALFAGLWMLPVGLFHVKDMIVFFWFGVYAYPAYERLAHRRVLGLAALAASLVVCVVLPDFRGIGLNIHVAAMPCGTFAWSGVGRAAAKGALGLLSALGVLELSCVLARRVGGAGAFAAVSRQTMGIFFIHIQLLGAYYALGGRLAFGFAGRFALAAVLFAAAYALSVLSHAHPVVGALLWNPLDLLRLSRSGRPDRP